MTRLGMDVEVVEATGKQLKGKGQSISAVVRAVDALVNSADTQWWGARGRSFVTDWRSVHRPALLQAASAVEGLAQSAINQAGEQRGASSAGGVAGPSQAFAPGSASVLDSARQWLRITAASMDEAHWDRQSKIAELLTNLGRNSNLVGPYSTAFHNFADTVSTLTHGHVGFEELRYKSWLNGPLTVDGPLNTLSKSHVVDAFGWVGTGVSILDNVTTAFDGNATVEQRVFAGTDALASGLKQTKGVGYLGGVAISAWSEAAKEAQKVDWSSSAMKDTWDFAVKNPTAVWDSFAEAGKTMLTDKIWKIF